MKKEFIKKHRTGLFLDKSNDNSEDWVRIRKATEFTRSMNPATEEYDYIADEHPTTEVTDYKPSESMSVKTIKGEEDFDLFYELYKKRAIGDEAHRKLLTVFYFDSKEVGEGEEKKTYYYAEKEDATITVNEYNASDSSISIDINHNGTPEIGYVEVVDGKLVFTEGEIPEDTTSTQEPPATQDTPSTGDDTVEP